MTKDILMSEILLIGIPFEWQNQLEASLENEKFKVRFLSNVDDAIKVIQSGEPSGVIIASDLVFDTDVKQDLIELTYGKTPTLTIIHKETVEKHGQEKVFNKIYNPKALQEFCTVPFDMQELILRLRKVIKKADR